MKFYACHLTSLVRVKKLPIRGFWLFLLLGIWSWGLQGQDLKTSPEGLENLVIYEIATKAFISPDGPESGTFLSTSEKMEYLHDLGINAIWLSGHNWADTNHFYNIWTQYATIRPDSTDPSLGTRQDLKTLVDSAHHYGIKVFLDVITHGVDSKSPLIKEHPIWFEGGSWGMIDYAWEDHHQGLDDWWVKTWTDYVLELGIDGYRLDSYVHRPDLWRKIKQICAENGHPIVIISEPEVPFEPGAFDFYQHHGRVQLHRETENQEIFVKDLASFFLNDTCRDEFYFSIQMSCHDQGWFEFTPGLNPYVAEGSRFVFGYTALFAPAIPFFMSGEEWNADYVPLPRLSPYIYGRSPATNPDSARWLYGSWIQWDQLRQPEKIAMREDVKKMIRIRKEESDVITAMKTSSGNKRILSVPGNYDDSVPVPYLMWNEDKAILVAGNPSTEKDLEIQLNLPLDQIGHRSARYRVVNLWGEGNQSVILSRKQMQKFRVKIGKDRQPGGGIAIYKIEKL